MKDKSPNLEVVSDGEGSGPKRAELRRVARLNLSGEQFRLGSSGKVFSVADLSREGMALRIIDPDDLIGFQIAARVSGTLNIRGRKLPVECVVRHLREDRVGCEFAPGDGTGSLKELSLLLEPSELGREMRPVPSPDRKALWYHGPSGADLLIWRAADGRFHRLILLIFGTYVKWDEEGGMSTGAAGPSDEKVELRGVLRFETLVLVPDSRPDPAKLDVAKRLVLSSSLEADLIAWFVKHLGTGAGPTA